MEHQSLFDYFLTIKYLTYMTVKMKTRLPSRKSVIFLWSNAPTIKINFNHN